MSTLQNSWTVLWCALQRFCIHLHVLFCAGVCAEMVGNECIGAAEQPRSSKQTMTPIATESSIQRRLPILLQAKSSGSKVVLSYLNEERNKGFILLSQIYVLLIKYYHSVLSVPESRTTHFQGSHVKKKKISVGACLQTPLNAQALWAFATWPLATYYTATGDISNACCFKA